MPPVARFQRFDVRPVLAAGGDPLSEIRRKLDALPANGGLLVIAPFLPSPLIERLGGEGYASRVERGGSAGWMVYFWRD
jgi:hypothetical protein